MLKNTAPSFSAAFSSRFSSWSYIKESFAGTFEALEQQGAFVESGPGEKIWETRNKYVLKIPVGDGTSVVYKTFHRFKNKTRYLFRPSPAESEARNYQIIANLGIPVPEFLAAGDWRRFCVLKNTFVITRFAEGFQNGWAFLENAPTGGEKALRDELMRRSMVLLARCHDGGVLHRGFTPANVIWKKLPEPDQEGNRLELLWLDLASCRRMSPGRINRNCFKDIALFLRPFDLSPQENSALVEIYCSARKKVPPQAARLKTELQERTSLRISGDRE